ncbi:MAG: hypothetical protein ACI9FJ_002814 [Alteromonadaceae bacterium]|jgi:hypothetical protein
MTVKRTKEAMAKDALCIAGETFLLPGTSLLAKGEYKAGLVHAGIGLAAKVALGPVGLLLVAANSYCKSKTGEGLVSQFAHTKGPGDFSLREEVAGGISSGDPVETIVEGVSEDVEDIYHEMTLEAQMEAGLDENAAAEAPTDTSTTETTEQTH